MPSFKDNIKILVFVGDPSIIPLCHSHHSHNKQLPAPFTHTFYVKYFTPKEPELQHALRLTPVVLWEHRSRWFFRLFALIFLPHLRLMRQPFAVTAQVFSFLAIDWVSPVLPLSIFISLSGTMASPSAWGCEDRTTLFFRAICATALVNTCANFSFNGLQQIMKGGCVKGLFLPHIRRSTAWVPMSID